MMAAIRAAEAELPPGSGVVLLQFRFNAPVGARVNYIGNCNRSDMLAALKEMVARWEGRGQDAAGKAMKLTIEPTPEFFMAGDVMVRMWQSTSDAGVPVVALVTAVAFPGQAEAFTEGLVSIPPPTHDDAQRWAEAVMARRDTGET